MIRLILNKEVASNGVLSKGNGGAKYAFRENDIVFFVYLSDKITLHQAVWLVRKRT